MNKQILSLVAALAIGATAAQAQEVVPFPATPPKPTADAFYVPPAQDLGELAPGSVLRYRVLPTNRLPSGAKEGYQMMYRSTNGKGLPVAMITTLFVPKTPATSRKLLSYQSFYDSLTLNCSPSGQTSANQLLEKSFFQSALSKGIHVVMADYEGLESQWIAARNSGQGVLDSIRAAQSFSRNGGLNESTPVGMIGYSGGGFATAWAAELAPSYAPELNIIGAAEGGLPVNPINVAKKVDGTFWAGAYLGALVGMSRAYPEMDINDYATTAGLAAIKDIGTRCLTGSPNLLTAYAYKKGSQLLKDPNFLDLPEIQAINAENTMGQFVPTAPLYVFESVGDQLMPIADVDNLVKFYCAGGAKVQYKRLPAAEHVIGAASLSGGMTYIMDRFAGKPVPNTCN